MYVSVCVCVCYCAVPGLVVSNLLLLLPRVCCVFFVPELYCKQTQLNNCRALMQGVFFLSVSRTSCARSPSAPRSQSVSLGCQGSNKVPSSQLEGKADWFQRVPLKNARHAHAVGLSVVPAPTRASFARGPRNVTRSRAFAYIMPGWLLGGRWGLFGSEIGSPCSVHVIFLSSLQSAGCVREVSLGHATVARIV